MKKRERKIYKNLLALLVGIIIALILGFFVFEIALRIFNPFETRIKGDKIILPSNVVYEYKNTQSSFADDYIIHSKNSIGFRGPEIPLDGLENYFSIIAVGGSTTESAYVSDNKTWPEIASRKLNDKHDSVWINNAGLDGHSTYGHFILIQDYICEIKPDYIMFLIGINDVGREDEINEQALDRIKGKIKFNNLKAFVKSTSTYSEVMAFLLNVYRSQKAKMKGLEHKSLNLTTLEEMDSPEEELNDILREHKEKYIPIYQKKVEKLINITNNCGIDIIFITQPMLFGDVIDPKSGRNLSSIKFGDKSGGTHWKILELYNDKLRAISSENNIFLIDLAKELPKDSTYFYDSIHFTNEGSAKIGQIVSDNIDKNFQSLKR